LFAEYRVDLRSAVGEAFDWGRESGSEWTVRRLWAYVNGLPADAAVWRDHPNSWTQDREAMATLIEHLSQGQIRVPRPGGQVEAGRQRPANVVSMADFAQKFGSHGRGGEK
jgi:hypothetical protein